MNVPWGSGRFARVLVYGLGLSGRAAARFLLARGVAVVGVDRRSAAEIEPLELGDLTGRLELHLGEEPSELRPGLDGVVVSPGVPMDRPLLAAARAAGLPVLAEVELAYPFLEGAVVAITGSNGKSTTTALTGAMLRAAGRQVEVCGNIGQPLCAVVDGPAGRAFVVELSSFQIEGIATFRPHAAALVNLAEDHLDRYSGMAEYGAAKKRLFRDMGPADTAVLNGDDREAAATDTTARRRNFSRLGTVADGCHVLADGSVVEVTPGGAQSLLFHASQVPLAGVQNLENAMAAALLARAAGATATDLPRALAGFEGLPHRLQRIGERGGVTWYDDSKGTNPAATLKSIEGFPEASVLLILGGRNKGADLSILTPLVARKARRVYLIGEAAPELAAALAAGVASESVGTLDRAVQAAAAEARPGEVVVLSPACASFDQFRNYVHRGERFQALVREILGGPHGEEARL
jgi:UDP-N-acetylmuramoylalanine--D-glutamate ligase